MTPTVTLLLVVACSLTITQACNRNRQCVSKCQWTSWSKWESCSASCGQNGIKVSTRVQIQLGSCEMSECYMKETKTDKCTSPCLHGRAIGGRCKCNDGFTGECCNVGDTVSVVEPCEKRGGVCLEYWQSCARINYDYGLCGRDGNRVCCIAAKVEKPTAPPVNMECKDKGGRCTAYWSDCAGGNFAYGICGTNSIYECCIPDKRVTKVIPTWENECKRQDGRCLFAWKTDCFGDILYGLCGGGGHECCVSNIKAANADKDEKCRIRGGHCVQRHEEYSCPGDCWSNFCALSDTRRCCIPNSMTEDFQCVQHGGRCQSLATCEGGQYRAGLCAGHAQRKCCIAGLEPLAHSFPVGKCSDATIVSRSTWGAESAQNPTMTLPVRKLIIHHTTYPACHSEESCRGQVRKIQLDDKKNNKLTDIGYNFLVGGDGRAYVGRGWGYMGGHSQGHNGDSVAIAAMGDFDSEEPSQKMIDAMANLIACAVQQGVLQSNYEMLAHRQVACTVCPGKYMCDVIKTSSHYSSKSSTAQCDN